MPQWDRYWTLGLAGSLAMLAASVTLIVWYLASLFALPQQLGLPSLADLDQMGGGVIWLGGIGGLQLLLASLGAHRRVRMRRLALGGDLSVIPLATTAADPANAPDVAHLPLMLPWRRKPRGREWAALSIATLILGSGPGILLVLAALLGLDWQTLSEYAVRHSIGDLIAVVLLMTFEAVLAVMALAALVRALASPLGPEYGVVADDEGISMLHLKGQGPRLRWGDARLLEVSQLSGGREELIFVLYSSRARVYWQDFKKPSRKRMRLEIGHEEFKGRQQALLALIASRTGLQPRTLSTALMCDDALAQRPTRNYRMLAYGLGYGLAGGLVLLAAAVLALPLTHQLLLDGYAATTTALAGLILTMIARQALKPGRASSLQHGMEYALPVAPPLAAEPLEVSYRRGFVGRLQDVIIGLVLLLDGVPAFAAQVTPPASPPLAFATRAVASLLFLVALIGLFAIVNAISGRRTTLTASTDGLRKREGRETTHLPWDTIVWLSLELEKGSPDSFTVLGRDGEMITWPVRGVVWRGGRLGQLPLSPEDLAAIVVQHSGVPLTIKEA